LKRGVREDSLTSGVNRTAVKSIPTTLSQKWRPLQEIFSEVINGELTMMRSPECE
jgi:hypothetical protein